MRPLPKFCVFVALAAILAVLFAFVPRPHPERRSQQPPAQEEQPTGASVKRVTRHIPGPVAMAPEKSAPVAMPAPRVASARVNMPAIRGANNYGWVQLPHGATVDFVRRNGRELWVRWDGTLVKIDSSVAATGAVVFRSASSSANG